MTAVNAALDTSGVRRVERDQVVPDEPSPLLDGVHPTAAGQNRRAQSLAAADRC